MKTYTAAITRRSTRKFKDLPVEAQLIDHVVEAGRHAPSGGNSQTTHFLVITKKSVLDHLAMLVQEAFSKMEVIPGMYRSKASSILASKRGNYRYDYHAPVLIVTANQKEYGNNMADCSCALENMMLVANESELGSCWINQLHWLTEEPTVNAYLQSLGLSDQECVCGALALGYADTEDGMPNRTPLPRNGNPVTYICD